MLDVDDLIRDTITISSFPVRILRGCGIRGRGLEQTQGINDSWRKTVRLKEAHALRVSVDKLTCGDWNTEYWKVSVYINNIIWSRSEMGECRCMLNKECIGRLIMILSQRVAAFLPLPALLAWRVLLPVSSAEMMLAWSGRVGLLSNFSLFHFDPSLHPCFKDCRDHATSRTRRAVHQTNG